jgi:hypothetical protein
VAESAETDDADQWRNGEYVVIPAQSSGATPARLRLDGTRSTNLWSTTMLSE